MCTLCFKADVRRFPMHFFSSVCYYSHHIQYSISLHTFLYFTDKSPLSPMMCFTFSLMSAVTKLKKKRKATTHRTTFSTRIHRETGKSDSVTGESRDQKFPRIRDSVAQCEQSAMGQQLMSGSWGRMLKSIWIPVARPSCRRIQNSSRIGS